MNTLSLHTFSLSFMLFSLLKHYLDLYITDTVLKVSRSLYCFTTSLSYGVEHYISPGCGVWPSLMLFYEIGHGGRVVPLSPPTSEIRVQFPARPQVGKLVVACRWSTVTVYNLDQLYVLVSSTVPTTCRDWTCTVLKVT